MDSVLRAWVPRCFSRGGCGRIVCRDGETRPPGGMGRQREAGVNSAARSTEHVFIVLGIACTCGTWLSARKTLRVRLHCSS